MCSSGHRCVSLSVACLPPITKAHLPFIRIRGITMESTDETIRERSHGITKNNKSRHSSSESLVASVSLVAAATAQAQGRNHAQARIGGGAVTDCCQYPSRFSRALVSYHCFTPAVLPVVVHPAFIRFQTCFRHTLIREFIHSYSSPLMRHPFLSFPLRTPTYYAALSLKIPVCSLIR